MEHIPPDVWLAAHTLVARNATNSTSTLHAGAVNRPPIYKAIGLTLAIASGLFIGTSFVLKKTGLLRANAKYNEEAGEGYGYLKNAFWWTGMTLMIVGEICNFVAYAFVDAILVTPLGALSVVVTTILSAIFLKERLSFVGKVGCFNCIIGSIIIVMNAPEQSSVADIQEMKHFVLAPGFLSYAGVIVLGCAFIAFWVGPRYGKKSMLVYLSICSLIGGLSVVATQGLGSAVVAQAGGKPQFNQWFLYLLLVFVVSTLVTEIIYLNKALNLFNAALVTPTYYVFFTSATIVTSAVLFQGFKGTAIGIATVIMGFLVICSGVVLLQMSKSAKDVPDAAVFSGDLDQVREIAEVEQPESEPKADAIRGTAALIRRISVSRQKMEQEEARRLREDKLRDQLEPLNENEIVEWDGLRRRKTIIGEPGSTSVRRRTTMHPPLGMSRFPDPEEEEAEGDRHPSHLFESLRTRAQSVFHPGSRHTSTAPMGDSLQSPMHPVALTDINVHAAKSESPIVPYGPGSLEEAEEHIYGLPPGLRREMDKPGGTLTPLSPRSKPLPAKPPPSPGPIPRLEARRQFSFTNFLHRGPKSPSNGDSGGGGGGVSFPQPKMSSRSSSNHGEQKRAVKNATEEERLGLVKGDSHSALLARHFPGASHQPMLSTSHSRSSSLDDQNQYHRATSETNSDEDDGWQMTTPPPQPSPSPYALRPSKPVPPADPPHLQSSTILPPTTTRATSRRRPSPPKAYHPPVAAAPSENQPPLATKGTGTTPGRVTPAATPYTLFPTLSTNLALGSLPRPSGQEGGREMTDVRVRDESSRNPEGEVEGHEASRRRFEEQSRREREERRIRAGGGAVRRRSWKPDDRGPERPGGGGGNDPHTGAYI